MSELLPEFKTIKRIPTCPESHRESIAAFLEHLRNKIELKLNDYRVQAMTDKSPNTLGQVKWYRYQLATLNWAIHINEIRRKSGTRGED